MVKLKKIKASVGDKNGHYIMTNGSKHQDDIAIVNIYVPSIAYISL